jgi:hypothetical protein
MSLVADVRPMEQEQSEHVKEDQVQQPQRHDGDHARPLLVADRRWSAGCATFWNPTGDRNPAKLSRMAGAPYTCAKPERGSCYVRTVMSRPLSMNGLLKAMVPGSSPCGRASSNDRHLYCVNGDWL